MDLLAPKDDLSQGGKCLYNPLTKGKYLVQPLITNISVFLPTSQLVGCVLLVNQWKVLSIACNCRRRVWLQRLCISGV